MENSTQRKYVSTCISGIYFYLKLNKNDIYIYYKTKYKN